MKGTLSTYRVASIWSRCDWSQVTHSAWTVLNF